MENPWPHRSKKGQKYFDRYNHIFGVLIKYLYIGLWLGITIQRHEKLLAVITFLITTFNSKIMTCYCIMNLKKKLSWTNRKTTVNFYQKKKE